MAVLEFLSSVIGVIAIAIIVWGVVLGLAEILQYEFNRYKGLPFRLGLHQIRHIVASYLLLGLEFLIAADIIGTIADPTLEELALLGGLVLIRTVISFFLVREIKDAAGK